jgi:hypothetical protein
MLHYFLIGVFLTLGYLSVTIPLSYAEQWIRAQVYRKATRDIQDQLLKQFGSPQAFAKALGQKEKQ